MPTRAQSKAEHRLTDLSDAAQAIEAAPLQIEAALDSGSLGVAVTDIEQVLDRMRSEGLESIFESEEELLTFHRVMMERIFARVLHLTDKTLNKVGEKLEVGEHSLRSLSVILDSLSRQETAVATSIRKALHRRTNDLAGLSDEELRAQVLRAEGKLRQLGHDEVVVGGEGHGQP